MYKNKLVAFGAFSMKYISKETYFRDMHLFLKHARDVAGIKGDKLVRTNLWIYFKGPTLK